MITLVLVFLTLVASKVLAATYGNMAVVYVEKEASEQARAIAEQPYTKVNAAR